MSDAATMQEGQLVQDPRQRRRPGGKSAAGDELVRAVRVLVLRGIFRPVIGRLTDTVGLSADGVCRLFGGGPGLFGHVARRHAGEVVDAIGLSPAARSRLSPRDERAIAMAVLVGSRLEGGE